MKVVKLKTESRTPKGTTGARRARRTGRTPAVVYGDGKEPEHVSVDTHDFVGALDHGARVIEHLELPHEGRLEHLCGRDEVAGDPAQQVR